MEPVLYIYSERRKRLIIAFEIDANYRGLKTNRRKESKVKLVCIVSYMKNIVQFMDILNMLHKSKGDPKRREHQVKQD